MWEGYPRGYRELEGRTDGQLHRLHIKYRFNILARFLFLFSSITFNIGFYLNEQYTNEIKS